MATALKPPSPNTVSGKPTKRRKNSKRKSSAAAATGSGYLSGIRSRIQSLVGAGVIAHTLTTAVPVAEVAGVGGLASALSGYRESQGKDLKIGPFDVRALGGLGFMAGAMYGRSSGFNPHLLNIGTGLISSMVHEAAFEQGSKFGTPAIAGVDGILSGDLDEAGLFGRDPEKRLERKLARLKKKADKKGVDWKDVTEVDKSKRAEKIMSKLGPDKAAAPPALVPIPAAARRARSVVTVPRGTQVFGPRGNVLPSFAARFPTKAARIRAGWQIARV